MTVREFIRTVAAGKYYVIAAVVVVVAGTLFYLGHQQTVYESTAVVHFNSADPAAGTGQAAGSVTVTTDPTIVTSAPVVDAAAKLLGASVDPKSLANSVEAIYSSSLLTTGVTARALTPEDAVNRANAFAQAYVAYLPTVLDGQVAVLDKRRDALRTQLDAVDVQIAAAPNDPLAGAERTSIINQYQTISAQRSVLETIVTPGQVVTAAAGAAPLGLSSPVALALAAMLGLVAGVGLAFARRGLDVRVRSAADASALAGSPVLAELYGVGAADREFRHGRSLPVSSRSASPYTESIRELRTSVQVAMGAVSNVVVVVTAADPHAPRSFITANLAASFALSGRQTIAVSGDLRRPQLERLLPPPEDWFGQPHELRPTLVPNLSVFPIHDDEMDPADYLATDLVRELIERLRGSAAVVVIDAPPVLAAADATILGGYANGVVLVAAAGRTDRVVLAEAADRLRVNNVPLAGIALAGVKSDRRMLYASTYDVGESDGEDDLAMTWLDSPPRTVPAYVPADAGQDLRVSITDAAPDRLHESGEWHADGESEQQPPSHQ